MRSSNTYFIFLRRWSWLIVVGIVAAVIATNFALADRITLYRATATVQIGRTLEEESPAQEDLAIADRLIPAYGELATRTPTLNAVIEVLELNNSPEQLRSQILVQAVPRTQLIDIHVVDPNPDVAAAVANEIARQIVLESPQNSGDSESEEFVQDQLADLQVRITEAQLEFDQVESSILDMTSAADIYDAQQRLEVLTNQIDAWQERYTSLLQQLEPSSTNIVRIVSPAVASSTPLPQQTTLYYGLAVVMGAGLATLVALGLSQLDRSIRSRGDVEALIDDRAVVQIPHFGRYRQPMPILLTDSNEDVTGSYRTLRNTVEMTGRRSAKKAFVMTSGDTGEGKTTTTANLGIALANSDRFVMLVDTNLRNPELEELFGVDNSRGFSDLLLHDVAVHEVVQPTGHPNLWVIGAGSIPANYSDLMASAKVTSVVEALLGEADIVLFDTPALSQEQESQLLARTVGHAILIAESGHTTTDDFERTIDLLRVTDASVDLVVFNKSRRSRFFSRLQLPWSRDRRLEARAAERRRRRASTGYPATALEFSDSAD